MCKPHWWISLEILNRYFPAQILIDFELCLLQWHVIVIIQQVHLVCCSITFWQNGSCWFWLGLGNCQQVWICTICWLVGWLRAIKICLCSKVRHGMILVVPFHFYAYNRHVNWSGLILVYNCLKKKVHIWTGVPSVALGSSPFLLSPTSVSHCVIPLLSPPPLSLCHPSYSECVSLAPFLHYLQPSSVGFAPLKLCCLSSSFHWFIVRIQLHCVQSLCKNRKMF